VKRYPSSFDDDYGTRYVCDRDATIAITTAASVVNINGHAVCLKNAVANPPLEAM